MKTTSGILLSCTIIVFASTVVSGALPPGDPRFRCQWHLDNTGQIVPSDPPHAGQFGADINILEAWDHTLGSPRVVIAVLDEGVPLDHPDLAANLLPMAPGEDWNAVNDGLDALLQTLGYEDPFPEADRNAPFEEELARLNTLPFARPGSYHGTAAAGLATAAQGNGTGGSGVCPECSLMPYKVSLGSSANWISGFDTVRNKAETDPSRRYIVSLSTGSFAVNEIVALREASETAVAAGVVIVAAAGNGPGQPVAQPARYSGVVAVGGSNSLDELWRKDDADTYPLDAPDGSTFGPELTVLAPSTWLTTTCYPVNAFCRGRCSSSVHLECEQHIDCPGSETCTGKGHCSVNTSAKCLADGDCPTGEQCVEDPIYTKEYGGTSGATPIVAGVAGLMLSVNMCLTPQEIMDALESSAEPIHGGFVRVNGDAAVEAVSTCGNGVVEPWEECDGAFSNGVQACADCCGPIPVGWLICSDECTYNTTFCGGCEAPETSFDACDCEQWNPAWDIDLNACSM